MKFLDWVSRRAFKLFFVVVKNSANASLLFAELSVQI